MQRTEVVLSKLPNRLGEHRARVPGDGTEFTGVREFVPGDRQRAINWPASTRLGRLQVNTFAAERSQDVVLLVDATSDVGEPGRFRARPGAARRGGRGPGLPGRPRPGRRDHLPVGRRAMAGPLARPPPGLQDHRRAARGPTPATPRGAVFSRLPRAALPPGALVIAFSPLLDGRFVEALRDMRERGFALIVVDVLNAEPPRRRTFADHAARRIWRLEQEAIRFSLRELGVPVVAWDGADPARPPPRPVHPPPPGDPPMTDRPPATEPAGHAAPSRPGTPPRRPALRPPVRGRPAAGRPAARRRLRRLVARPRSGTAAGPPSPWSSRSSR